MLSSITKSRLANEMKIQLRRTSPLPKTTIITTRPVVVLRQPLQRPRPLFPRLPVRPFQSLFRTRQVQSPFRSPVFPHKFLMWSNPLPSTQCRVWCLQLPVFPYRRLLLSRPFLYLQSYRRSDSCPETLRCRTTSANDGQVFGL